MPPPHTPQIDPDHVLPPHRPQPVGPMIGTTIIVILLIVGGLYFWGARLNKERSQDQMTYIPSGTTTLPIAQ